MQDLKSVSSLCSGAAFLGLRLIKGICHKAVGAVSLAAAPIEPIRAIKPCVCLLTYDHHLTMTSDFCHADINFCLAVGIRIHKSSIEAAVVSRLEQAAGMF